MLLFEQAFKIVLNSAYMTGTERIDIAGAKDRILAEDIISDMSMPPFDKSAVDGYACRRAELADELTVIETVPAGVSPTLPVGPNQCVKIMTGAEIPNGADCVVMVEFTKRTSENKIRFTGVKTADNICFLGEDIRAGEVVLSKGLLLKPQCIATLACAGCVNPLVAKKPRVGIITTGSELVPPSEKPGKAQIRDSNSCQLYAHASSIADARSYGIVSDAKDQIDSTLKKAMEENDVILLSGGVSMGDYDFVTEVLKQNGVDILFDKIAVKPGKPTVFGVRGKKLYFGLPGNPVAAFVIFELLIRPFLYKMMGHDYKPVYTVVPLEESVKIKNTERQLWLPVAITQAGTVKCVGYHGSAHISSLCGADGLISVDIGVAEIERTTPVCVRLI